jgi:hypothetical protein
MRPFDKPALSVEKPLELLKQRRLHVDLSLTASKNKSVTFLIAATETPGCSHSWTTWVLKDFG